MYVGYPMHYALCTAYYIYITLIADIKIYNTSIYNNSLTLLPTLLQPQQQQQTTLTHHQTIVINQIITSFLMTPRKPLLYN